MAEQIFDGVIEEGRGDGTWVAVHFDVEAVFGTRGTVHVIATFDGAEDQTDLAPMGGRHVLGLRKSIRETLGKGVEASELFDSLSFTYRKKMPVSIREAKKAETRLRRLDKAMPLLRNRQKPA